MIISQTKTSFLGVVFDVDHDFEGPRASKAHPDAVLTNLSRRLGRPFTMLMLPDAARGVTIKIVSSLVVSSTEESQTSDSESE